MKTHMIGLVLSSPEWHNWDQKGTLFDAESKQTFKEVELSNMRWVAWRSSEILVWMVCKMMMNT